MLGKEPNNIFLWQNKHLLSAIRDCRHLLELSTKIPTTCKELVTVWPHHIWFKGAYRHGIGAIIMGKGKACTPTVFRLAWPYDIKELFHKGNITNSDLEMAGLLMLWLLMEEVFPKLRSSYDALFSDNSPAIGGVKRLTARVSLIATQLVWALTPWLKKDGTSPLTHLHIAGE